MVYADRDAVSQDAKPNKIQHESHGLQGGQATMGTRPTSNRGSDALWPLTADVEP
jgi:hypothetical protein